MTNTSCDRVLGLFAWPNMLLISLNVSRNRKKRRNLCGFCRRRNDKKFTNLKPTACVYSTCMLSVVGLRLAPKDFRTYAPMERCMLPNLDPLDASVLPYVDPNYDPLKNCKRTFVPMTRIRNGRVEVVQEDELAKNLAGCEFRYETDSLRAKVLPYVPVRRKGRSRAVVEDRRAKTSHEVIHCNVRCSLTSGKIARSGDHKTAA